MIDALQLGKLLAEDILTEEDPKDGICLYPGRFRPPHSGHFEAVKKLAENPNVKKVVVIVSNKVIDGITPEDAVKIWHLYLEAQPLNNKVQIRLSNPDYDSPFQDMQDYIARYQNYDTIYIAGNPNEKDDKRYMDDLQNNPEYKGKVKAIPVDEKTTGISAPQVRELIKNGDKESYESFKQTIPVAAFNKGAAPKIWKLLTGTESNDQGQKTN